MLFLSMLCQRLYLEGIAFILSDRSDFHVIDNLLIAIHVFTRHILMSLSVDEMLLPRYVTRRFTLGMATIQGKENSVFKPI